MPIRTVETTDGLYEYTENEIKNNGKRSVADYLDELYSRVRVKSRKMHIKSIF
jgi:predicted CopG family antitoxin